MSKTTIFSISALLLLTSTVACPALADPDKNTLTTGKHAYFGDLHLHTRYSFDAYVLMGNRVDPDTAYRFAKGETVEYLGTPVKRDRPLDFLAVTDHAENIGFFNQLDDPDSELSKSDFGKIISEKINNNDGMSALREIGKYQFEGKPLPGPDPATVGKTTWRRLIDTANNYNEPGVFTTFIGYEWTAMIDGANLHRNIIFRGSDAPMPFTSTDSRNPEDLWHYLESARKQGYEALAIPHNANASNGLMFDWVTQDGKPIDESYARLRAYNEPLNEIAQNKGSSETHPALSPNDEFADFELFEQMLTPPPPRKGKVEGSYLRQGLGRGLVLQNKTGVNPYKFGFVGASDLHSGMSASAEKDYAGSPSVMNMGGGEPDREQAAEVLDPALGKDLHTGSSPTVASSGTLTGVWAEENTRESIYSAFRRREVFATSGTRLKLLFFGGWRTGDESKDADQMTEVRASTVPMGSDLPARPADSKEPEFRVWALKDPDGANLDRAQIIKVWLENGEQKEKVYDVVWSGDRALVDETGKLPAVGNTVDLKTGNYANSIGAMELSTVWTDPDFRDNQSAAYYLRVLEIPTPRWSTLLAIRNGLPLPQGTALTIQERGWSSPIWYTPQQEDQR